MEIIPYKSLKSIFYIISPAYLSVFAVAFHTLWFCGAASCQSRDQTHECKRGQINVVCSKRSIKKGETISPSSIVYKSVPAAVCPKSPILNADILWQRKAPRRFRAGHIFARSDFSLPSRAWPEAESCVLYAVRNIQEGQLLKEKDLARKDWKGRPYPQGAFSNPDIIINRPVKYGLQKDQIILDHYFDLRDLPKGVKETKTQNHSALPVECMSGPAHS